MRIDRWISQSSIMSRAVVVVEQGEVADICAMARLLDGDSPCFHLSAEMVGTGSCPPAYKEVLHEEYGGDPDWYTATEVDRRLFALPKGGEKESRYYFVRVDTD